MSDQPVSSTAGEHPTVAAAGLVRLQSLSDPRLEPYRNLKATNRTRWSGLFVVEGEKLTRRLLASGFETVSVLAAESHVESISPHVPSAATLLVVPDEWVEQLVGFNFHRGVLACGRRTNSPGLQDIAGVEGRTTLVVCPDVQDPENLGAILRIGAALGVAGLILGGHCANPFSRRVLRVSMGASLRVPIVHSEDLAADLRELRDHWGFQLAATVVQGPAEPLQTAERSDRLAVLFGSEGHGLADEWLDLCDRRITIPMQPGTDSLNVAVAAGIILHHFTHAAQ